MSDQAYENTDRELYRDVPDDYYSPHISVTKEGGISISVGGSTFTKTISEWHKLAIKDTALTEANAKIQSLEEQLESFKAVAVSLQRTIIEGK